MGFSRWVDLLLPYGGMYRLWTFGVGGIIVRYPTPALCMYFGDNLYFTIHIKILVRYVKTNHKWSQKITTKLEAGK
jgi:hypothetical protein